MFFSQETGLFEFLIDLHDGEAYLDLEMAFQQGIDEISSLIINNKFTPQRPTSDWKKVLNHIEKPTYRKILQKNLIARIGIYYFSSNDNPQGLFFEVFNDLINEFTYVKEDDNVLRHSFPKIISSENLQAITWLCSMVETNIQVF